MLNQVNLIGRICQDIEINKTQSGASVANVSVAVNEKKKDQSGNYVDHTEFVRCVLWNKTADLAAQYLGKGSMVYFGGKLATTSWEDQNGGKRFKTEVIVRDMKFLPTGNGSQQTQTNNQAGFTPKTENDRIDNIGNAGASSGNIPFSRFGDEI